jgi:DNA-binding LacI/PurR family transcriptional regulator
MRYCRNSRRTPAPGRTIAYGDFSESGGVAAMKTLLERDTDLDAVFAASDLMAAGWPSC